MRHERWRLPAARLAKFRAWFHAKSLRTAGRARRTVFFAPPLRITRHFFA
jgi:hypothetical protein